MSAEDWKTVKGALYCVEHPTVQETALDALDRLELEAAAVREVLERVAAAGDCRCALFKASGLKGPCLLHAARAALSWGGANTGETQAAERKVGK